MELFSQVLRNRDEDESRRNVIELFRIFREGLQMGGDGLARYGFF